MDNGTVAFATRMESPAVPEWRPLGALARLSRESDSLPWFDELEFMYMGAVSNGCRRRLRIHLYKHRETRRYFNLDDAGHAYEYRGPLPEDENDPDSAHGARRPARRPRASPERRRPREARDRRRHP